ncbi:Eco57I restriction-modification methylase domain-containing protein [Geminocystis sp.]|uniref:Eco57I restriction-modification methylase domain-containing protein n=1 Tax=Geminocystis sp. TaxID=2664100 RepID=UPI003593B2C6
MLYQKVNKVNIEEIFSYFVHQQKKSLSILGDENKKTNGVFFTNCIPTIDTILESLPHDQTLFNKIILDPCCGEGIFLLRIILKAYLIVPEKTIIQNFIEQNLYFVDIDEDMINKTKENISRLYKFLFDYEFEGNFNYYCLDFTLIKLDLFSTFSQIFTTMYGKLDYVIGNPPYISLYGRRDQKKNENQRIFYLENYQQFPSNIKNGKINYIMLFIEQSLNFLQENGTLSFIIDIAFLETAYQHCRKYLVENYTIKSLIYNLKVFDKVTSGQIIIEINKQKPSLTNKIKIVNLEINTINFISQSDWDSPDDEFRFRLPNSPNLTKIINKIYDKKDPTLKYIYPHKNLRTCAMLLNMENRFTGNHILQNDDDIKTYPYYRGSHSIKYKYSKPIHDIYFYYDKLVQDNINNKLKKELTILGIKNKKRIGLGEMIIYDNPKVYIRQSAKELIATYDPNPSSGNNSLYVFSLRDKSSESIFFLKYLCGLINSNIYTFFAQQRRIIRYNKGKQPQIKIADLYQIFIPNNYNLQQQIVQLVDHIYEYPDMTETYKNKIDKLLFDYYELDNQEIKLIQEFIVSFVK